jgi:hypothetical protein
MMMNSDEMIASRWSKVIPILFYSYCLELVSMYESEGECSITLVSDFIQILNPLWNELLLAEWMGR